MTGFDPRKRNKASAPASGFNLSSSSGGSFFHNGVPAFSLQSTEPAPQGQFSVPSWGQASEGQQYFHDTTAQGHSQNGFPQTTTFQQMNQNGQSHGRTPQVYPDTTQEQWNEEPSSTQSVAMSRYNSQSSMGGRSQRTTSSVSDYHDQTRSVGIYPHMSQVSFPMSSAPTDVIERSISPTNSAGYTPTQPMDLQSFDSFQFQGEDMNSAQNFFPRESAASFDNNSVTGSVTTDASVGGIFASAAEDIPYGPQERPSQSMAGHISISTNGPMTYNNGTMGSPQMWAPGKWESQTSSPVLFTTENWAMSQQLASTSNSPMEYPSSTAGLSPRYDLTELPEAMIPFPAVTERTGRKPVGPRLSKVASDLSNRGRFTGSSAASDESFKLATRPSVEIDNTARDHPLYQTAHPGGDGLYHCPWEGQASCGHKPEKLKCNYDKFVDSHLKPYRCKVHACENLHFSSTACLLRHEREAHAMHGHGDKPYLCKYEGCDRGVPGNGFPRSWNLKDHMKRVHNDPGLSSTRSNASGSPTPSIRGTKRRKAEPKEPEKETAQAAQQQQQGPSDVDRYHQSEQRFFETVKRLESLHNPQKVSTMLLLRDARNYINQMAEATQRIHAPPGLKRTYSQQSG